MTIRRSITQCYILNSWGKLSFFLAHMHRHETVVAEVFLKWKILVKMNVWEEVSIRLDKQDFHFPARVVWVCKRFFDIVLLLLNLDPIYFNSSGVYSCPLSDSPFTVEARKKKCNLKYKWSFCGWLTPFKVMLDIQRDVYHCIRKG